MRTTRAFRLRRLVWRARRNVPRVAQPLSLVLPDSPPPRRPILLIGCPRSGTSILLRAFLESPELRSIQAEGHILWDAYHHPRKRGWDSDARAAADVLPREREYVYCATRLFVAGRRFVDKTPENCLRIPYLESLFPDATYVFLRRRAADNVNSLIEGWRARPRFVKYRLPERLDGLGPLSGNLWSFVLVPGWRDLRHASLEEICAHQYVACNDAVLAARDTIDPSRWLEISYEDLVASPVDEVRRLFGALGLAPSGKVDAFAASLDRTTSATALTPPRAEKWREQNRDEIERILPLVAETERRLGYEGQPFGSSP
ncbi:MAG: sulfotransferase [Actinobacteria bacterium]|nr:sulfotransferase [Actinomycetota bacterium]